MKSSLAALSTQLGELMLRDQQRLRRRLQGARKINNPEAIEAITHELEADIATAMQRVIRRRAACPAISYPENLPVSQKKQDIYNAIRDHQVVIVAGETGSGKTTQLPKICSTGAGRERGDRPYPAASPALRALSQTVLRMNWIPLLAVASVIKSVLTIKWVKTHWLS